MNRGGRKRENPGHLNDNSEIKSGFCFALSSNSRELLTRECSELFCQRRCIRNESVNLSLELVEQKKKNWFLFAEEMLFLLHFQT